MFDGKVYVPGFEISILHTVVLTAGCVTFFFFLANHITDVCCDAALRSISDRAPRNFMLPSGHLVRRSEKTQDEVRDVKAQCDDCRSLINEFDEIKQQRQSIFGQSKDDTTQQEADCLMKNIRELKEVRAAYRSLSKQYDELKRHQQSVIKQLKKELDKKFNGNVVESVQMLKAERDRYVLLAEELRQQLNDRLSRDDQDIMVPVKQLEADRDCCRSISTNKHCKDEQEMLFTIELKNELADDYSGDVFLSIRRLKLQRDNYRSLINEHENLKQALVSTIVKYASIVLPTIK